MSKRIDINEATKRLKQVNPQLKIIKYNGWTVKSKVTDGDYTYMCRIESVCSQNKPWANHPVKGKDSKYTKGISQAEAQVRLEAVLPTVKIKKYNGWTKQGLLYCTETKQTWKARPSVALNTIMCGRPRPKVDRFRQYNDQLKEVFGNRYKLIEYKAYKSVMCCSKHGNFVKAPWACLNQKYGGCSQCRKEQQEKLKQLDLVQQRKYEYPNGIKFVDRTRYGRLYNCPIHGNFYSTDDKVLKGCGCLRCIADKLVDTAILLELPKGITRLKPTQHLKRLRQHYTWLKLTLQSKDKPNLSCRCSICGHTWETIIHNIRKSVIGCPKCGRELANLKTQNEPQVTTTTNNSRKGLSWILWLEKNLKIELHGAHNKSEHCIQLNKKKAFVDGYNPSTNEVYEFLGDYWHGNALTKYRDKDKFANTMRRLQEIASKGYIVHYVWEADFDRGLALSGTIYGQT